MIADDAFVAPGAQVSGEVDMGPQTSVWYGAALRGEAAPVVLEAQVNVQDNAVVESTAGHSVRIGQRTSLGHNARVIGAIVEERSLIAIGAAVLPGACVGSRSIVAANATVPEGMQVPPGSLVIGKGRILREVRPEEIARIERGADDYVRLGREHRLSLWERSPRSGG